MMKARLMRTGAAVLLLSGLAGGLMQLGGCLKQPSPPPPPPEVKKYPDLPPEANLPEFMKGTVLDKAVLMNVTPLTISGFGIVADLRGTGENTVPSAVRTYMIDMMYRRGWGAHGYGYEKLPPEKVLRDPRIAIVRVDGLMPPGIRKDERFDIQVSVPRDAGTTSLAHGRLWQTALLISGADELRPSGVVNALATSDGPVFVNPAYAVGSSQETMGANARTSLRYGVVMNGGRSYVDRPLLVRVRQAQFSMTRAIDNRINHRFQKVSDRKKPTGEAGMAMAQDEGVVQVWVPRWYRGDWQHYANVIMHLYLDNTPEFAPVKSRELAVEALKENAPLMDISYCWEGLGPKGLPAFAHLISHEKPEISFAAARAAAFLDDIAGQDALMSMAGTEGHPFQLNAIQALGSLPDAPVISQAMRKLLDSPQALARIEAYRILARQNDGAVYSHPVRNGFFVDIVQSKGAPLVYASRRGAPRIAIFGDKPTLQLPLTFAAMDNSLTITSVPNGRQLSIFYRGPEVPEPVRVPSNPDLADLIARLGGEGAEESNHLRFSYGDVVGITELLLKQRLLQVGPERQPVATAFVLQEDSSLSNPMQPSGQASADAEAALQKDGVLPELMPEEGNRATAAGNGQRPQ